MGEEKDINFTHNKPQPLPQAVPQPSQNQWQQPQSMDNIKPQSAKKTVKFAMNYEPNNDHFTKPTYLGQVNPPINQNRMSGGMRKSQSMPSFDPPNAPQKSIPNREPSTSGFKPSFLTSEPDPSSREQQRFVEQQPASYPSGYSDKAQLGASAARITGLMKSQSELELPNIDGDGKVNFP